MYGENTKTITIPIIMKGPVENGDKSQFDQLSDFQSNSYVCLSRTFIQNMTPGIFGLIKWRAVNVTDPAPVRAVPV